MSNLNGWKEKLFGISVFILLAIPSIWFNINSDLHPSYMNHKETKKIFWTFIIICSILIAGIWFYLIV